MQYQAEKKEKKADKKSVEEPQLFSQKYFVGPGNNYQVVKAMIK